MPLLELTTPNCKFSYMRTESMPYSNADKQQYAGIFSGVSSGSEEKNSVRLSHGIKSNHVWWFLGASAVVLLSATGYHFRKAIYEKTHPLVIQELATGVGQRKLIKLSDGTQIWISPGSVLNYPQAFNREVREITVTGEAFIKVATGNEKPFIVHSNGVETKTIGGDFTVQAYEDEAYVAVTLTGGKATVTVQDTAIAEGEEKEEALQQPEEGTVKTADLVVNERAVFIREEKVIVKQKFASADKHMQSRINGTYEFWGMPANEVVKELKRQFSDPVELRGNYYNCKYYGELKAQLPIEKFLKLFCESINAKLTKENGVWIIQTKGC